VPPTCGYVRGTRQVYGRSISRLPAALPVQARIRIVSIAEATSGPAFRTAGSALTGGADDLLRIGLDLPVRSHVRATRRGGSSHIRAARAATAIICPSPHPVVVVGMVLVMPEGSGHPTRRPTRDVWRDLAMSEDLHHHPGRNGLGQQQDGRRVMEIMETGRRASSSRKSLRGSTGVPIRGS